MEPIFANAVNMCGVWSSQPRSRETIVEMHAFNESGTGAQFYESTDAQDVSAWTKAAQDECLRFRRMLADYKRARLAEISTDAVDGKGREAFLHSLTGLG